jgi:hypothetical protein
MWVDRHTMHPSQQMGQTFCDKLSDNLFVFAAKIKEISLYYHGNEEHAEFCFEHRVIKCKLAPFMAFKDFSACCNTELHFVKKIQNE